MNKIFMLALLAALPGAGWGETLKSFDGYGLDYVLEYPENGAASKVVILLHGSGGHDMDEDLSAVSAPGTKNRFFVDVSSALRSRGFTVLRYNKRSYQWKETLKKDPGFLKSDTFLKFSRNGLKYFYDDAAAFVDFAAEKFPKARIYLLGHSEGTSIALRLADADKRVAGTALVGFMAQSLDVAMFEQTVYRPLGFFERLDSDHDANLNAAELAGEDKIKASLRAQLPLLDLGKDGKISRDEFMAGNYSNLLLDMNPSLPSYRRQETEYKRPGEILKAARFDVAFFQGELDNQTPVYCAKAVQLANDAAWKKSNLHFRYFPGLGHALDPRDSYEDILFRQADKKALETMAADLAGYWSEAPGRTAVKAESPLARKYNEGEVLKYKITGGGVNNGPGYYGEAVSTVRKSTAGVFYEEWKWSGVRENGQDVTLPDDFRQYVSLDPAFKVKMPELMHGPFLDTLNFYVDIVLARRQDAIRKPGDHAYVKRNLPNSWAFGDTLVGYDCVDFDITFTELAESSGTAAVLVKHVPPPGGCSRPAPAEWMNKPVSDTANNFFQVKKADGKYSVMVGKEVFNVEVRLSVPSGKILSAAMYNPVAGIGLTCSDAKFSDCGAPEDFSLIRNISMELEK
jgi:hypothetical protein